MILKEAHQLKKILDSFLGESKQELNDSYQLEYPCPRCRDQHGSGEDRKYNLSVSISKNKFQCWKCSQYDDEMKGNIFRLIRLFGNEQLLKEYKDTLRELRSSRDYQIHFDGSDFGEEIVQTEDESKCLPKNYRRFIENGKNDRKALAYLKKRGIGWDIINEYSIGYTTYDETLKKVSSRIIIPSFDAEHRVNYWTGRDFLGLDKRQKYFNPKAERKSIIFNEDKIQWDADITLCEGPMDSIVFPNFIPLLGKTLKPSFKVYQDVMKKANGNVNIWLDNDAIDDAEKIYNLLNHGRLKGKIRIVTNDDIKDPSEVYEKQGKNGVIQCLCMARRLE